MMFMVCIAGPHSRDCRGRGLQETRKKREAKKGNLSGRESLSRQMAHLHDDNDADGSLGVAASHGDLVVHTPGPAAIVMASSWKERTPHHPHRSHYQYTRGCGPNYEDLASALRAAYPGAATAHLFCSGTAALAGLMAAVAVPRPDDGPATRAVVLCADEVYGGTTQLFRHMETTTQGFAAVSIDCCCAGAVPIDQALVEAQRRSHASDSVRLIHVETCSNPSGFVVDLDALAAARDLHMPGVPIAVDNSWMSVVFNPLAHGADAIVESLTKHVADGRVILGAIVCADTEAGRRVSEAVGAHAAATGQHVSPFDTWLAAFSIGAARHRVARAVATCTAVARHLDAHPAVHRVLHQSLESHPSAATVRRLFGVSDGAAKGSPLLLFHVPLTSAEATAMIDGSDIVHYARSYGKAWPLFDPRPIEGQSDDRDRPRSQCRGSWGSWVRFAAGHEMDAETTIAELDRLLRVHVPADRHRSLA
ncbi:Aspartate aminotransferase domain containing protein [Pandoravirus celtis]|uniref:Aspartate aminotransferase domain containing protein n=1 Tax=Pandoravirus celtis TaxID=2568002 RepID=A0A4D6EFY4_9VIRU|nr:Aspartate aminotransferase domain containing protein [Pandoravirus celtis]